MQGGVLPVTRSTRRPETLPEQLIISYYMNLVVNIDWKA
jgi:hypothetical protein